MTITGEEGRQRNDKISSFTTLLTWANAKANCQEAIRYEELLILVLVATIIFYKSTKKIQTPSAAKLTPADKKSTTPPKLHKSTLRSFFPIKESNNHPQTQCKTLSGDMITHINFSSSSFTILYDQRYITVKTAGEKQRTSIFIFHHVIRAPVMNELKLLDNHIRNKQRQRR